LDVWLDIWLGVWLDASLDALLDSPSEAVAYFFDAELKNKSACNIDAKVTDDQWWNHTFAMRAVVYEILCSTSPAKFTLLDLLERDYAAEWSAVQSSQTTQKGLGQAKGESLTCIGCGATFFLVDQEKRWFLERKMTPPKRCITCRKAKQMKNNGQQKGGKNPAM